MGVGVKRGPSARSGGYQADDWQARSASPLGRSAAAGKTSATRPEADRCLARLQHERATGDWIHPRRGELTLRDRAASWMPNQLHLKPETKELPEPHRSRLLPAFGGGRPFGRLRASHIQTIGVARFQGEGLSASRCRQGRDGAVAGARRRRRQGADVSEPRARRHACRECRRSRCGCSPRRGRVAGRCHQLGYRPLVHVLAYGLP